MRVVPISTTPPPAMSCVIPGGKTPEQVRKNVQAAGLRIPEDMRQRLADVPGFVY